MVLALSACVGAQDSMDARFVAGLNQRQLFELAEFHCRDQLSRSTLPADRRAESTRLLIRTLSLHAMNSPPDERMAKWQQAEEAFQAFAAALPQHPSLPEVELELLWNRLRQGEVLRLEADLTLDREPSMARARDCLRAAIRDLESLRDRLRPGDPASGNGQMALRPQIDFALASAYRRQALSYPENSPDQVHLLNRALGLFNSIARIPNNSAMAFDSRFAEIDCLRRLGNLDDAAQRLQDLQSRELKDEEKFRLVLEQTRLSFKTGQVEAGVRRLAAEPRPASADESLLADGDLALMEGYIELWRDAIRQADEATAQQWQSRAGQLLKEMEQTRSAYWVRRAGQLLAQSGDSAADIGNLHVLERTAEHLFAQQDLPQAAAAYLRAAALAKEMGDQAAAFQLGMRSAAIVRQQGDVREAVRAFRNLALSQADEESATEAHVWAIRTAADAARNAQDGLATYTELLQEHVSRWPQAKSADQVRLWWARLLLAEDQPRDALEQLLQIDPSFEHFDHVVQLGSTICLQQLDQATLSPADRIELTQRVADYLEDSFLARTAEDTWTAAQRSAALVASRLRLLAESSTDETLSGVADYLAAALASAADGSAEQQNLRALLGVCLARLGKLMDAQQLVRQVDWTQVDRPLDILALFAQGSTSRERSIAKQQAEILVDASERLRDASSGWPVEQQQLLVRYRAESLLRTGEREAALPLFQQLAVGRPQDPIVLEGYARCLQQTDQRADLEMALELWRKVVRWSPTATERWFFAKLSIAQLHIRLGDAARAEEIIRLTQALHPELGGEELARQFQQVLQECKTQTAR